MLLAYNILHILGVAGSFLLLLVSVAKAPVLLVRHGQNFQGSGVSPTVKVCGWDVI